MNSTIDQVTSALADYRLNEAAQTLYHFFWDEFCDWYIEFSKTQFAAKEETDEVRAARNRIVYVLETSLRLLHPLMPFITEELWHGLGYHADLPADQGGDTILFARWPKPLDADFKTHYGLTARDERFVDAKYELVTRGRNLRRELNIPANKKVKFVLKVKDPLPVYEATVIRLLLNAEAFARDFQAK